MRVLRWLVGLASRAVEANSTAFRVGDMVRVVGIDHPIVGTRLCKVVLTSDMNSAGETWYHVATADGGPHKHARVRELNLCIETPAKHR